MFLPIGWPFFIVSYIRNRGRRRHEEDDVIRRHWADIDDFYIDGDHVPFVRSVDSPDEYVSRVSTFEDDQAGAQEIYASLRGDRAVESLRRQKAKADARLQEVNDKLTKLSHKLRKLQQERQEATVEARQVGEHLQAREAVSDEVKAEELAAEFARIRAIKGVKKVRQLGDQLSILVHATLTYQGMTYDKGEWELRISAQSEYVETREVRSGVRSSWTYGSYPDYRFEDGTYCFGGNATAIRDNLKSAQYLQALELAVTCLNSANDDDRYKIPDTFQLLREVHA
jgi:hypothetical protein